MKPGNKNWDKFCDLLEGEEGCDFKEKEVGKPDTMTWRCKGGMNKDYAKAILKKYFSEINIPATMEYFDNHGGHCDCEILFNVDGDE